MHPQDTSFLANGFHPTIAAAQPQDVMAFRQNQALGAQRLQEGNLELQQKQQEMQDQTISRQAYMDSGGDMDKFQTLMLKGGASPKAVFAVQQQVTAAKEAKAKLTGAELDNQSKKNDQLNALLAPVNAEQDPVKQAQLWDQQTQIGIANGVMTPDEAAKHPYPGSPQAVSGYVAHLATDKWLTAQAAADSAAARKKTADTGAAAGAAKLPGEIADSAAKTRTDEMTKANLALRAAGSDQKAYALAYGELKGNIASNFTNPSQFDPAKTPGENDRVLMTPEQRKQADQKTTELAATAARDANTAANQKAERIQRDKEIGLKQVEVGIAQKRFDATLGQGLDANGKPLSPEDRKNAALSDPTAVAMANYQIPPPSNRTTALGSAQYAKVLAIDPAFDGDKFADRHKINLDYGASGATGKAITSTDTALAHIGTVRDAGRALKTNDLPALNKLAQAVGVQAGSSAPVVYDAILETVSPEISKAVIGAAGGVEDRKAMKDNFSRDKNDAQREGALGGVANLLGARYHKQAQAYESDMGKPLARKLSPESQGILDSYSGAAGGAKSGAAPAPTLPPAAKAQLKEGMDTKFSNGQVWTLRNGKETQVK